MLSGEVIVRSPSQKGRLLTSDDSPIEVTKLQSMMSLLAEEPVQLSDEHIPHHLLVEFPQPVEGLAAQTTIAIHLFSKAPGGLVTPISEVHAVNFSPNPDAKSYLGNLK